jgi:GPH family glycoside/pentoside/hexuronide:cation symporter
MVDTCMRIFLFKFLVDEAQLPPVVAGTVLLVGKIWDAINDPLVGRLSDRTNTRMGARRPWIAGGLAPFLVCFVLLWCQLPWHGAWRAGAYVVLLILLDTFLTTLGVPYSALSQALTRSYDERTRLNALRVGWGMLGALLAGAGMPFLAERTGSWAQAGLLLTVMIAIPLLIMLRATRGYDVAASTYSEEPVWSMLHDRAFRRVVFLSVTSWPCLAVASALLPFYCQHHLGHPERLKLYLGTAQLSALLLVPLLIWLSQRLEKHRVYALGLCGWLVAFSALALLPRDAHLGMIVAMALAGPGMIAAYIFVLSLVPDVAEAAQVEGGANRVGAYYGVINFLTKLGTSLALWLFSLALQASGYVEAAQQQPESARVTMLIILGPVLGTILGVSLLGAWWYPPITRDAHAQIMTRLQRGAAS